MTHWLPRIARTKIMKARDRRLRAHAHVMLLFHIAATCDSKQYKPAETSIKMSEKKTKWNSSGCVFVFERMGPFWNSSSRRRMQTIKHFYFRCCNDRYEGNSTQRTLLPTSRLWLINSLRPAFHQHGLAAYPAFIVIAAESHLFTFTRFFPTWFRVQLASSEPIPVWTNWFRLRQEHQKSASLNEYRSATRYPQ